MLLVSFAILSTLSLAVLIAFERTKSEMDTLTPAATILLTDAMMPNGSTIRVGRGWPNGELPASDYGVECWGRLCRHQKALKLRLDKGLNTREESSRIGKLVCRRVCVGICG